MNLSLKFILIVSVLCSCGSAPAKRSTSKSGPLNCETLLLYSGTDVKFESSALAVFNPCNGRDETLLRGQSSDAVLFETSIGMFLVNRANGHQSIRSIKLNTQDAEWSLELGDEISLSQLSIGDPHDMIAIDSNHLLFANFVGGDLSLLRLDQPKLTPMVAEGLKNNPRRFESLILNDGLVLALEQGLAPDFSLNDAQSVHRLEIDNLDSPAKLTSLGRTKLIASIPDQIHRGDQELITVGLCSQLHLTCQARIERLSLDGATKLASYDLSDWKHSYFGRSLYVPKSDAIYYPAALASGRKAIISVYLDDLKAVEVFEFPPKLTSGYWGLFYDHQRERLLVADAVDTHSGMITSIDTSGAQESFATESIPYSGVVINF